MAEALMETEDDLEETNSYFRSSYLVIAIDTHSSMFKAEGQPTPFKNCLRALYKLSDFLLLKSDKGGWSPFSIQLYDRDEKATLVNFRDNMIKTTKLLKEKSSLGEEELKKEYMRDYDLDLAAFFQFCKKKFKDISTSFYRRILILITNDPDPVLGDASKRFTALHEARNFAENDITFELIVTNEDFKFATFYNELFSLLTTRPPEIICEDEEGLFEKLISTVCFRLYQRKVCFYPFADDFTKYLSMIQKNYIKNQKLLNNSFIAKDGTALKRIPQKTQNLDSDFTYLLFNADDRKSFENCEFTIQEQMERDNNIFPIGFTLLYVCHRLSGVGEVVNHPKILEADTKEELPFFNQFWQYCVNNDKVLVCAKVMKRGESPNPVELIPKLIRGNKVFLEKNIAYADEIYQPEKEEVKNEQPVLFTEKQKNITDELIQQLTFDFQSSFLIDAEHNKKVDYVKSKLLEEERKDVDIKDLLSTSEIDEKMDNLLDDYFDCFPPEKGVKRKK